MISTIVLLILCRNEVSSLWCPLPPHHPPKPSPSQWLVSLSVCLSVCLTSLIPYHSNFHTVLLKSGPGGKVITKVYIHHILLHHILLLSTMRFISNDIITISTAARVSACKDYGTTRDVRRSNSCPYQPWNVARPRGISAVLYYCITLTSPLGKIPRPSSLKIPLPPPPSSLSHSPPQS